MIFLFLLVLAADASSVVLGNSDTLTCSWACDDPVCHPVCYSRCEPPLCTTQCMGPGICLYEPHCEIRCDSNVTVADQCPLCETICQPLHTSCSGCSPLCQAPNCSWVCVKPGYCPQPRCELQCEAPVCAYASAERLVPLLLLLVFGVAATLL